MYFRASNLLVQTETRSIIYALSSPAHIWERYIPPKYLSAPLHQQYPKGSAEHLTSTC